MFACKNVCLLGFAILSIRKEGRASVVICVCVYWHGTVSQLGRTRALQMRPDYTPLVKRAASKALPFPIHLTTLPAAILSLRVRVCVVSL